MPSTKRDILSGEVEACCHRVSFWYDIQGLEATDELRDRLTTEAEERAAAMIAEGYWSGELNCCHVDENDGEHELRGWWSIKSD